MARTRKYEHDTETDINLLPVEVTRSSCHHCCIIVIGEIVELFTRRNDTRSEFLSHKFMVGNSVQVRVLSLNKSLKAFTIINGT